MPLLFTLFSLSFILNLLAPSPPAHTDLPRSLVASLHPDCQWPQTMQGFLTLDGQQFPDPGAMGLSAQPPRDMEVSLPFSSWWHELEEWNLLRNSYIQVNTS